MGSDDEAADVQGPDFGGRRKAHNDDSVWMTMTTLQLDQDIK